MNHTLGSQAHAQPILPNHQLRLADLNALGCLCVKKAITSFQEKYKFFGFSHRLCNHSIVNKISHSMWGKIHKFAIAIVISLTRNAETYVKYSIDEGGCRPTTYR